jgi:hypothetical protein
MTGLVVRPLVAGEENLFESMPDPLPELRQVSYADGLAGGGFRPEHTWIAMQSGRVVCRAAWLQPPGAVGEPWLERFDLDAEPEIGAAVLRAAHEALGGPKVYYASMPAGWRDRPQVRAVAQGAMAAARLAGLVERGERLRFAWTWACVPVASGRFSFRPARDAAEINALVGRIAEPDLLTGAETASLMRGVDLARNPLDWLTGPPGAWRIAFEAVAAGEPAGEPAGLAAAAGDACYPMVAYLGVLDEAVRGELLADTVATLVEGGALEVVADGDAHRTEVTKVLVRNGFAPTRARIRFEPPG